MVFELLSVSVFDFLKENAFKAFPQRHVQQFARQLFQSVAFLHGLTLVHTDLKPENILLVNSDWKSSEPRVKRQKRKVLYLLWRNVDSDIIIILIVIIHIIHIIIVIYRRKANPRDRAFWMSLIFG